MSVSSILLSVSAVSTNSVHFYSAFTLEQVKNGICCVSGLLLNYFQSFASLGKKTGHIPSICELFWWRALHLSQQKDQTLDPLVKYCEGTSVQSWFFFFPTIRIYFPVVKPDQASELDAGGLAVLRHIERWDLGYGINLHHLSWNCESTSDALSKHQHDEHFWYYLIKPRRPKEAESSYSLFVVTVTSPMLTEVSLTPTLSCSIVGKHKARIKCIDVRWLLAQPSPCGSCWRGPSRSRDLLKYNCHMSCLQLCKWFIWFGIFELGSGEKHMLVVSTWHPATPAQTRAHSLCWNLPVLWGCF